MTKRDKRLIEKRKKAAAYRIHERKQKRIDKERRRLEKSGYEPPKPDPGTPCQTCIEAAAEIGMDVGDVVAPAEAYWMATDQNPDPEARLYRMEPVCLFHAKYWHALYTRHNTPPQPDGQQDLYGGPDRSPSEMTIDGLVALMSASLNSELDALDASRPRRKRGTQVQFHDEDMIRHALQWTTNDVLIMGAWAQVMSSLMETGSFSAAGPEDVVPNGGGGRS